MIKLRVRVRERLDATLLALKMKERAMRQGMWETSRSWKRQGKKHTAPKAVQLRRHLDFHPLKAISGFELQNCKITFTLF